MEVTVHNTVSLDGAVTGFPIDVGLHYGRAPAADLHLVGSRTALTGIETFLESVPEETEADRHRPPDDAPGGLWVVPDSTGCLEGLLHVLRGSEHCRDVCVLVSGSTPAPYLEYLKAREYRFHRSAGDRVDLEAGLRWAMGRAGGGRILADGGPSLFAGLIKAGLVHRISLVVAPHVTATGLSLFRGVAGPLALEVDMVEPLRDGHVHLRYTVAGSD